MSFAAKYPSAGSPIARLLQIVFGVLIGLCRSRLLFTQSAIGLHPAACAPYIFVATGWLTSPTAFSSVNALWILPISAPPAIGQTTCCGNRQPRSSAISKPIDLDPSA